MRDPFESIHKLLKQRKLALVLRLLLDSKHRVKAQFRGDVNHAWYLVGDAYQRKGDYQSAITAFKRAFQNREEDLEALWAIGDCYSEIGRPILAERYYRKVLQFSKHNVAIRFNLGNALFDQGKYGRAISVYRSIEERVDSKVYRLAQKNLRNALMRLQKNRQQSS